MRLAIAIVVGIALGILSNLVSNYLAPKAEQRRKLIWSLFVGVIALSIIVALVPETQTSSTQLSSSSVMNTSSIRPAADGEALVLIASFQQRGNAPEVDFRERIYRALITEIQNNTLSNVRAERVDSVADENVAKEVGSQLKASIVIWGWYDSQGYFPSFEILVNKDKILPVKLKDKGTPINPDDFRTFQSFVSETLPTSMTVFTNFTIGQIYYYRQDYLRALPYLDLAAKNVAGVIPYVDESCPCGLEQIFCLRGFSYYELGRYGEAIENYKTIASLKPSLIWPHSWLATLYRQTGEYKQAETEGQTILKIASTPNDKGTGYHDLGLTYKVSGKLDLALEQFNLALKSESNGPGAASHFYERALIEQETNKLELAKNDFASALKENPSASINMYIYEQLAAIHKDLREYEPAIGYLTAALAGASSKESKSRIYYLRGWLFLAKATDIPALFENALSDYDHVIQLDPNGAAYHMRAQAYRGLGKHQQAIADLQKAIDLDPPGQDDAADYYFMALSKKAIGDRSGAISDLKKCIELDVEKAWTDAATKELATLQ